MDVGSMPPPDKATWSFDQGGVYHDQEHEVTVTYSDLTVTIEVGSDSVTLAAGTWGSEIGRTIYAALQLGASA